MSYNYRITSRYCYHEGVIVDMFFINGVPFTFDDLPEKDIDDPYVKLEAEDNLHYTAEDMYKSSSYLIEEECHPLVYELNIENPEELPRD